MCYTPSKIESGVGALRESDDTHFLKPNANLETSMSMVCDYSVL